MAKSKEQWWVSKRDMTLGHQKVGRGQLVQPAGDVNDHIIFGDNTRWAYLYHGDIKEALECGSDGCDAKFDNLGSLDAHRRLVHGPERDARMKAQVEAARQAAEAEQKGETIGGHPVVDVKSGPRGRVPYIAPFG